MPTDLRERLLAAANQDGRQSSDYDLNADVVLPEGRVLRPAGVLVGMIERDAGASLILTKRTSTLKHHPGQIAFPGGKVDDGDAGPVAAALREANEEIGLQADNVEVVATLPEHETVTGFSVTPVLALVKPFDPVPEAGEVAEVFEVPLQHVLDAENYGIEGRRWRGRRRQYFTVPWGPYYIWGATARMLRALADRMNDDSDRS